MYAVTPEVESLWRELLGHITREAGIALEYLPYPAPQPLEHLWARPDMGAVFMCGFPISLALANVVPLAAPIPRLEWARGRAYYRTDLIVRANSPYTRLEDTFSGRLGWTVEHSHSGFNALRHHLLAYRTAARPVLYHEVTGQLITARNILDQVRDGRIDIGPLDAFWHALLARHAPQLCEGIRVLQTTELAPMPAFVASGGVAPQVIERLRSAFLAAAGRNWFGALAEPLLLSGFAPVEASTFAPLLEWDRAARAAGYPLPA